MKSYELLISWTLQGCMVLSMIFFGSVLLKLWLEDRSKAIRVNQTQIKGSDLAAVLKLNEYRRARTKV